MADNVSVDYSHAKHIIAQIDDIVTDISQLQQLFSEETNNISHGFGSHAISHLKMTVEATLGDVHSAFNKLQLSISSLRNNLSDAVEGYRRVDEEASQKIHAAMDFTRE